jgi:hypothetical protein
MSEAKANMAALIAHARSNAKERSGLADDTVGRMIGSQMAELIVSMKVELLTSAMSILLEEGEISPSDVIHYKICPRCCKKSFLWALEFIASTYDIDNLHEVVEDFLNEGNND